jgi:hypothetical protein
LDPSLFVRLLVGTPQDFVGLIQRRGLGGFPVQGAHQVPVTSLFCAERTKFSDRA